MLHELLTRIRFLLRRKPRLEVDEELRFHLEHQIEANITAGMSPEEARRQATIAFGSIERAREECREERPGYWAETFLQDVRYALRGFRRNPTLTLTIVLTLMLGIGATTAVFSVVDRILFRSLPYGHADRLVSVGLIAPIYPLEFMLGGSYYEWQDHQKPFEALTSETGVNPCDLSEEKPARLNCASVEANFLPSLGLAPALGRNFTPEEDRPNAPRVALISYPLWQTHFGGDPGILNRLVNLDGKPARVIGVLPQEFEMPTLEPTDVVVPQALNEAEQRTGNHDRVMFAFARLKPGVSIEQAKKELRPVFDYSLRLAPAQFRSEVHLQVRSLRDRQMHDVRLAAWVLFGVVMAVLLIACANVTSLLMARGAARERELAVRSALGAGRARLVRQTLTESLVLSVAGAVAGCVFAELMLRIFLAVAPKGIQLLSSTPFQKTTLDVRIILFTLLTSLICGAISGLAPALRRPRAEALAGRTTTNSHAALRQAMVIVQIAASMVLLAAGALLFRSFLNLQNQRLGMRTESIVTASVSLGQNAYPTPERRMAFFQQLQKGLKYGPGVAALAISDSLPPGGNHGDEIYAGIAVYGQPAPPGGTGGMVAWRWVTPDYFKVLGIPILQGRGFTDDELSSSEHFVVLSKSLSARLFPGQNPIGQRLGLAVRATDNPPYTIAGVVDDVKNAGLTGADEPEYYRLRRDVVDDWNGEAVFIVKTNLPADTMEKWLRAKVAAIDPTVPVEIETLSEKVGKMADQPRFETLLVSFFAAAGLLLAVVGLYGVISFLVRQRTQEIGLRMALGATRADILELVIKSGLRLILTGTLVGLITALALSHFLSSLLFSVGPHDPFAFAFVTLLLVIVALVATLIPATSAVRVDPTVALRRE
jgi:putative ABC transport system permease protein